MEISSYLNVLAKLPRAYLRLCALFLLLTGWSGAGARTESFKFSPVDKDFIERCQGFVEIRRLKRTERLIDGKIQASEEFLVQPRRTLFRIERKEFGQGLVRLEPGNSSTPDVSPFTFDKSLSFFPIYLRTDGQPFEIQDKHDFICQSIRGRFKYLPSTTQLEGSQLHTPDPYQVFSGSSICGENLGQTLYQHFLNLHAKYLAEISESTKNNNFNPSNTAWGEGQNGFFGKRYRWQDPSFTWKKIDLHIFSIKVFDEMIEGLTCEMDMF